MSKGTKASTDFAVRPYRDDDEAEVLDLLRLSLGGGPAGERPAAFFRWKHLENPFGRSYMTVAEGDGRIVGFRSLLRWRFEVGGRTVEAVRPVDTATHPDHRGRGVFSTLTLAALDALRGEVDLVFNTPNPDSLRGYLKMGWRIVGDVPISIRIRKPTRFAAWRLGRAPATPPERPRVTAPAAADVVSNERGLAALLERAEVPAWGMSTPRSLDFLRWRYADAPLLGYHAVAEERGGRLTGMALFRLRPEGPLWGVAVADVIVERGDEATARRLLRSVRRSADVAYVATTFPAGTAAAGASRSPLSLPSPKRPTLVANPLRNDLRPDPLLRSSWALSAGDVEVF
jgi:GNAT superfamily N-acetyltransferase